MSFSTVRGFDSSYTRSRYVTTEYLKHDLMHKLENAETLSSVVSRVNSGSTQSADVSNHLLKRAVQVNEVVFQRWLAVEARVIDALRDVAASPTAVGGKRELVITGLGHAALLSPLFPPLSTPRALKLVF